MAAMMSFHTEKCRPLVSAHEASARTAHMQQHPAVPYSIFELVKINILFIHHTVVIQTKYE